MPFVKVDNTRLFYRLEGDEARPVLILSHSIGADHSMWAPQAADLLPHFQLLRYDIRGHGASDAIGRAASCSLRSNESDPALQLHFFH